MFKRPSRGRHGTAEIISAGPAKTPIGGTSSGILLTSHQARPAFRSAAALMGPPIPRNPAFRVLFRVYTAQFPPRSLLQRRLRGAHRTPLPQECSQRCSHLAATYPQMATRSLLLLRWELTAIWGGISSVTRDC